MTNPIEAISAFFEGAATKVFNGLEVFLLRITVFGVNILEILLFLLFIALVIGLFVYPIKVYGYYKQFESTFSKVFGWLKK